MKDMKIICMIPVWRRPEILNICINRFKAVKPWYAEVEPVFIISQEDPDYELNYQLVRSYKYLIYKNNPLGAKKNAGMSFIMNFQWDYFMDLNSDNVFTMNMWHAYKPYFDDKVDFFGFASGHIFYYLKENKAYRVDDYAFNFDNTPTIWNGGRMIRRDVIEKIGDLWRNDHHTGMDGMSHHNIITAGFKAEVIPQDTPMMLNFVSFTNLTTMDMIEPYAEELDTSGVRIAFGLDQITPDIRLLTFNGFHMEVEKQAQQMPRKEDAFNQVNLRYRESFGVIRYKSYDSYKTTVSKFYK